MYRRLKKKFVPMELHLRDEELIKLFKDGDTLAFQHVHKTFYQAMCVFAYGFVRDQEEAKDIASGAFLKLYKRHQHFESLQTIKTFLYITTRNDCIKYLKKVQVREKADKAIQHKYYHDDEDTVIAAIKAEILIEVGKLIKSLPKTPRRVMEEFLSGKSTREIASELGLLENTVRKIKSRTISLFREKLKELRQSPF